MGFLVQVVALNALGEDCAGQMLILRDFSGLAAPVVAGDNVRNHARLAASKISYGIGYWMWVSATFLMMMGLPIEMKIAKKEN